MKLSSVSTVFPLQHNHCAVQQCHGQRNVRRNLHWTDFGRDSLRSPLLLSVSRTTSSHFYRFENTASEASNAIFPSKNVFYKLSSSAYFYIRETSFNMLNTDVLKPFAAPVWITYLAMLIIFSPLLRLIFRWEVQQLRSMSAFVLLVGAFCQQGFQSNISLSSTRCLIIFVLIASVAMNNFYTSVLVSTIVETKRGSSFKIDDDLIKNNIPIGFLNTGPIRAFINVRCYP